MRVEKLMKELVNPKWFKIRLANGNFLASALKNKYIAKQLALAGITSLRYINGKFYDQFGRQVIFYNVTYTNNGIVKTYITFKIQP